MRDAQPSAGLSGFAVFVSVMGIFLALFLLLVPVVNEKFDKLTRLARALKEDRTTFVLVGTGTTLTFLLAYVVSTSLNSLMLNFAKLYHHYFSMDRAWV
jgi:hypothetical protein